MATLVSAADGNFTAATTWKLVDATSYLGSEAASTGSTTSYVFSAAFAPGAITIDAFAIKVARLAAPPSGTCTIGLQNQTDANYVEEITFNIADIPAANREPYNRGWFVLKMSAPATLLAGKNYRIAFKASGSNLIYLYRNATTANWSRMLVTTTNQAPAVNDILHIAGEFGPSSTAAYTVVMDNTATTSFGATTEAASISVNYRGTLNWAVAASTNYLLTWKGYFSVLYGTVNVGTPAAPIPATSTATLLMNSAAAADSGIYVPSGQFNTCGAPLANRVTRLQQSVGGWCRVVGAAVTALAGSQSFLGLTGTIKIGGTNRTIASVTDATHLTLTASITNTDTYWVHPASAVVLQVDDTTGWTASGTLCLAPSVYNQHEQAIIASVDSTTQVSLAGTCAYMHYGAEPMRAHAGYLTRNVLLRGNSASLTGFLYFGDLGNGQVERAQIYWMGRTTATPIEKRGVRLDNTTGAVTFRECTNSHGITDTHQFYIANNVTGVTKIVGCISYNPVDYHMECAVRCTGSLAVTDNLFVGPASYLYRAWFAGTYARNVIAGFASSGLFYPNSTSTTDEANDAAINDCEFYAGALSKAAISGMAFGYAFPKVEVNRCRFVNTDLGIQGNQTTAPTGDWTFNDCTWIGCGEGVWMRSAATAKIVLNRPTFYAMPYTQFPYEDAIRLMGGTSVWVNDGTFTGSDPNADYIPQYAPVRIESSASGKIHFSNCRMTWPYFHDGFTPVDLTASPFATFTLQRLNGTVGADLYVTASGSIFPDTVISASGRSLRFKPETSATLNGARFYAAVANGESATVSVQTRESVLADGQAYTGKRPELWVEQNAAAGYSSNTLLAVATSAGSGAFAPLAGVVGPVSDNAVLKLYVSTGGTAYTQGWVNVDTASWSSQVSTRDYSYWNNAGEPLVTNAFVAASGAGGGSVPYAT